MVVSSLLIELFCVCKTCSHRSNMSKYIFFQREREGEHTQAGEKGGERETN